MPPAEETPVRSLPIAAWIAALLALPPAPRARADAPEIRGRVVAVGGEAAADVRVGTSWTFASGTATARWRADVKSAADPEVRSDADGAFAETLYFRGRPVALMALDLDGSRGGIAIVDEAGLETEHLLTLQPLTRVRAEVEIEEPALADEPLYVYVFDARAPIAIVRVLPDGTHLSFALPPGAYRMSVAGKDLQRVSREFTLEEAGAEVDLGPIGLQPTNLARHFGKPPPPWTITAARGVDPSLRLEDLEGRWVLIEFWSYG